MDPIAKVTFKVVTIADSATASDIISVQGYDVVSIQQPADCEGTAFTFNGNVNGSSTVVSVVDNGGNAVSITKSATAAQLLELGTKELKGLSKLQVVAGTAQTGAATILVGLRMAG